MKITFLGTGTSQGVPVINCNCNVCVSDDKRDKRLRTSVLIEYNNTNIVIDAGPDFRAQMLNANNKKLDAILLTHAHQDHVAGLDDVRAYNYSQQKSMPIFASYACMQNIKRYFDYAFFKERYPGVPDFSLFIVDEKDFNVENIKITPIPVVHGKMDILGFRIDNFAYITDASFIPENSIEKLKNLDLLVLNALRFKEHHSHFTVDQAVEIINILKPKKTYLTHLSHLAGKYVDLLKYLPENIEPAYDELKIEV
jgi:phosphoribosyl 1,2-cyclic phosphate phosphodiesterase